MDKAEQYTPEETEQRLRKIMRAAFSGPPTPLKDIPKRNGKPRASRVKAATRKARKAS
jgi:hypothetical protein